MNDKKMEYIDLEAFMSKDILDDYCLNNLTNVDFEYVISLKILKNSSKEIIEIYYDRNLYKVYNDPPKYYSKYKGQFILIWSNSLLGDRGEKSRNDKIFETAFPEQYSHYIEKNFFPPPVLFRREKRIYENGSLIETTIN